MCHHLTLYLCRNRLPWLLEKKLTTAPSSETIKSTLTLGRQLWCAITRREEKKGGSGQTGSKNILPPALIVPASVLLSLSPRQAENTNWKHTFKVSTHSISFNQTALTVTDCQARPWPCPSSSAYCAIHVKLSEAFPSIILLFPLQETADNYIKSLQVMIIIWKCKQR